MDTMLPSGPTFVDLFCGAGFGARGAVTGGGVPLLGIDAWDLATQTYAANFASAKVLNSRIEDLDPESLAAAYQPDVLLTSPECTAHSIARGARPGAETSRETAIGIVPWIKSLKPRWVIVENVNRMKKWKRHDELVTSIENEGYTVSDLLLNSSEFGSAQARKRMFLICDRLGTSVTKSDLLKGRRPRSRRAADIISPDLESGSPLRSEGRAQATLDRADRAIEEIGSGVPFLIVYYGSDYAGGWQRLDAPLRTVTTIDRFGLVTWQGKVPYLRMLQPDELSKAMSSIKQHSLPFGSRREKVKLCGNGVSSEVMTHIFYWISAKTRSSAAKSDD
jgi:DNA (cytosine-5)-methyltransferase 1